MDQAEDLSEVKKRLREQAHEARNAQPDKEALSQKICTTLVSLPEYERARTIMYYVDVRSEVRTRHNLPTALQQGRRIVVPYCVENELDLFWLENMEELVTGKYKILEPSPELRKVSAKRVLPGELDLIVVPGVAFDARGARMGHGFGYYDRLLQHARPDAPLVALAFECQLFPEIPTQSHDVFMDKIVTEKAVYEGRGRGEK